MSLGQGLDAPTLREAEATGFKSEFLKVIGFGPTCLVILRVMAPTIAFALFTVMATLLLKVAIVILGSMSGFINRNMFLWGHLLR